LISVKQQWGKVGGYCYGGKMELADSKPNFLEYLYYETS
jgi:hypothetical protein